jgi:hypothetical protein
MKGRIANVIERNDGPQIMPPRAVVIAVKRALRIPVFGIVRIPSQGRYFYSVEQIA